MTAIWEQEWFWPALAVVVLLPVVLLVLTEVLSVLERRKHPAAGPVRLTRNFLVPLVALLVLLGQLQGSDISFTWSRVVATLVGFLVILVVLSGFNVALFSTAGKGSWRDRLPKIFIDLARLVLIVIGLAVVFSVVWSADVGGLFTALGVSSIVIGLALQNAAGSVVSGLLLLFEQPFSIGDYLDTGDVRGRVVDVNWRSVHIDTGNGIHVIPNASLADSSFQNLSRSSGAFISSLTVAFATDDPPYAVQAVLISVGSGLTQVLPGVPVTAASLGAAKYAVSLPLTGPADEDEANELFLSRIWYAARRAGLHLDNDLTDDGATPERVLHFARAIAPSLHLLPDEMPDIADRLAVRRYGAGEVVLRAGELPHGVQFVVEGFGSVAAPRPDGEGLAAVKQAVLGDIVGVTALTRQGSPVQVTAVSDLTTLYVPIALVDEIVAVKPELAREMGRAIDSEHQLARVVP